MTDNIAIKRNLSSMQVLKTLLALIEDNYTMSELIKVLNANEDDDVFNNSIISKYINTCRYCGINIPKIHNKYFVASMPFGLNITQKELNLIEFLENTAREKFSKKNYNLLQYVLQKISRFSNKQIFRVEDANFEFISEIFKEAIKDSKKVRLLYKVRKTIEGTPVSIIENNNRFFFCIKIDSKEKKIPVERIAGIEILSQKSFDPFSEQSVIYKLKGDLAKRYIVKDDEQLFDAKEDGEITIVNKSQDKGALISRLLRYDSCCEIVHPKNFREDFINIIKATLENYGE